MGIEIHEKTSAQGTRFRVWDNRSNGYWHKSITKEQLPDALLTNALERAVGDVMFGFKNGRLETTKVTKWNRQPEDETDQDRPAEYWERVMAELYGAKISIDISTAENGTKTIVAKIETLPKK